jgi:hypothetical protein
MPLTDWALNDNAGYSKHQDEIDSLILGELLSGPKRAVELIEVLRNAGFGNARNNGPLELSYSMTGAIYRSAYNSLRSRGFVCDSYDKDGRNYARPSLVFSRSQLLAAEGMKMTQPPGPEQRVRILADPPPPPTPEVMV